MNIIESLVFQHIQMSGKSDWLKKTIADVIALSEINPNLIAVEHNKITAKKWQVCHEISFSRVEKDISYTSNRLSETMMLFSEDSDMFSDKIKPYSKVLWDITMRILIKQSETNVVGEIKLLNLKSAKFFVDSDFNLLSQIMSSLYSNILKDIINEKFKNFELKRVIEIWSKKFHKKIYLDKSELIKSFNESFAENILQKFRYEFASQIIASKTTDLDYEVSLFLFISRLLDFYLNTLDEYYDFYNKKYEYICKIEAEGEFLKKENKKSLDRNKVLNAIIKKESSDISPSFIEDKEGINKYEDLFIKLDNLIGGKIDHKYISKIKRIIKNKWFIKLDNIIQIFDDEELRNSFLDILKLYDIDIRIVTPKNINLTADEVSDQIFESIDNELFFENLTSPKTMNDLVDYLANIWRLRNWNPSKLKESLYFLNNKFSERALSKKINKILLTINWEIAFENKWWANNWEKILVIDTWYEYRLLFNNGDIIFFNNHDDYDHRLNTNKRRN